MTARFSYIAQQKMPCEEAIRLQAEIGSILNLMPRKLQEESQLARILREINIKASRTSPEKMPELWHNVASLLNEHLPKDGGEWVDEIATLFWTEGHRPGTWKYR